MNDKRTETWRVVDDVGGVREIEVRPDGPGWCMARFDGFDVGDATPRAAIARFCASALWPVAEILAPGEPTRSAALAAERERIAGMLRNHGDDRVNDAPEYAEAIYDAEALVRGERPVYAPRATMAEALATARADGACAMRDAAVAAVKRRAEELDAGVNEDEAADDEEGYGRFQEALDTIEMLGSLPLPAPQPITDDGGVAT